MTLMREDIKWVLTWGALAFAQKPEGHQCGRLTRIIKVCSNEDVWELFKCVSEFHLRTGTLQLWMCTPSKINSQNSVISTNETKVTVIELCKTTLTQICAPVTRIFFVCSIWSSYSRCIILSFKTFCLRGYCHWLSACAWNCLQTTWSDVCACLCECVSHF